MDRGGSSHPEPQELVRERSCHGLGVTANFCPSQTCEVAYFDAHDMTVPVSALLHPVYPKHPDAPICPCLNVPAAEIQQDAERGDPSRVRELLKHAQSPAAQCARHSPSARSCVADVQKLYLRYLKK